MPVSKRKSSAIVEEEEKSVELRTRSKSTKKVKGASTRSKSTTSSKKVAEKPTKRKRTPARTAKGSRRSKSVKLSSDEEEEGEEEKEEEKKVARRGRSKSKSKTVTSAKKNGAIVKKTTRNSTSADGSTRSRSRETVTKRGPVTTHSKSFRSRTIDDDGIGLVSVNQSETVDKDARRRRSRTSVSTATASYHEYGTGSAAPAGSSSLSTTTRRRSSGRLSAHYAPEFARERTVAYTPDPDASFDDSWATASSTRKSKRLSIKSEFSSKKSSKSKYGDNEEDEDDTTAEKPMTRSDTRKLKKAKRAFVAKLKEIRTQLRRVSRSEMTSDIKALLDDLSSTDQPFTEEVQVEAMVRLNHAVQAFLSADRDLKEKKIRGTRAVSGQSPFESMDKTRTVLSDLEDVDLAKPESYNIAELIARKAYAAAREAIEKLDPLEAKNKVNEVGGDRNGSPLYWSCMNGELNIVKLLLKKQADVYRVNDNGDLPIHACIQKRFFAPIPLLLKFGGVAMLHVANKAGKSPLDLARASGDLEASGLAEFDQDEDALTSATRPSQTKKVAAGMDGDSDDDDEDDDDNDNEQCDDAPPPAYSTIAPPSAAAAAPRSAAAVAPTVPAIGVGMDAQSQMNLMMLQAVKELMDMRKQMDQMRYNTPVLGEDGKPVQVAAPLTGWAKFTSVLKSVLYISSGTLLLILLTLVVLDTRSVVMEEQRASALSQKEKAHSLYNKLCIYENMDRSRALRVYANTINETGHVLDDPTCDRYLVEMGIDPDKVARADSQALARKLAESVNTFVHTLSYQSWAFMITVRNGVKGVTQYAMQGLSLVLPGSVTTILQGFF